MAVEGGGGDGDGVEEEEEQTDDDDTDTRPKVDKGKAVMTGPWPDDDEGPRDYFLGPLNSNPPPAILSATLHDKRGSGWWSSDFLPPLNSSSSNSNNPRHASLQFLPSRQAARNMHRQSLPVEALRVASRGSAL